MGRFTSAILAFLALAALVALGCSHDGRAGDEQAAAPGGGKLAAPAAPTATPTPRPPTVVLDPGHGGPEVGAAAHGVVEKESNLDLALRVARELESRGIRTVLTRTTDARLAQPPAGAPAGFAATRADLQARIDLANEEEAELFISLHSNGSSDPGERGVEVWWDPNRPFAAENERLARLLLDSVRAEVAAYGYDAFDRGLKDDSCFRLRFGRCFPLYVLGPEREITASELLRRGVDPRTLGLSEEKPSVRTRATSMPGALVELLFISNAADAAVLRDEAGRAALARGVARAAESFLRGS